MVGWLVGWMVGGFVCILYITHTYTGCSIPINTYPEIPPSRAFTIIGHT